VTPPDFFMHVSNSGVVTSALAMVIEEATDRSSRAIEVRHQLRILILHYLFPHPARAEQRRRDCEAKCLDGL
jgi:hypothetical protein